MTENEISQLILDSAITVHRTLGGPGLLESVYQDALLYELRSRGLTVEKEVKVPVSYRGVIVGDPLWVDILVDRRIIIECKATEKDNPVFAAQILTYLRLMGLHLGILINFGRVRVVDGYQRVINGYLNTESQSHGVTEELKNSVPLCPRVSVLKATCGSGAGNDFNTESQSHGVAEGFRNSVPLCPRASVLKTTSGVGDGNDFNTESQSHGVTEELKNSVPLCPRASVLKPKHEEGV